MSKTNTTKFTFTHSICFSCYFSNLATFDSRQVATLIVPGIIVNATRELKHYLQ